MPLIRNFLIQRGESPESSKPPGKFSGPVFCKAVLPWPLRDRLISNNAVHELLTYSGLIDSFHI